MACLPPRARRLPRASHLRALPRSRRGPRPGLTTCNTTAPCGRAQISGLDSWSPSPRNSPEVAATQGRGDPSLPAWSSRSPSDGLAARSLSSEALAQSVETLAHSM